MQVKDLIEKCSHVAALGKTSLVFKDTCVQLLNLINYLYSRFGLVLSGSTNMKTGGGMSMIGSVRFLNLSSFFFFANMVFYGLFCCGSIRFRGSTVFMPIPCTRLMIDDNTYLTIFFKRILLNAFENYLN